MDATWNHQQPKPKVIEPKSAEEENGPRTNFMSLSVLDWSRFGGATEEYEIFKGGIYSQWDKVPMKVESLITGKIQAYNCAEQFMIKCKEESLCS